MEEESLKLGRPHDRRIVRTKPLEGQLALELSRRRPLERVTFAVVSPSTTLKNLGTFCSVSLNSRATQGQVFLSTSILGGRILRGFSVHYHADMFVCVILLCDMRDA